MKALNKEVVQTKPENQVKQPDTVPPSPTPRQQLVEELTEAGVHEAIVEEILSKYEVTMSDSKVAELDIVKVHHMIGDTVKVSFPDKGWNFEGEIIKILYRNCSYPYSTIYELMENPDMSEEQREMLKYSVYETCRPKIYHSLVLNDKNQGILIIPYLVGVIIEQE